MALDSTHETARGAEADSEAAVIVAFGCQNGTLSLAALLRNITAALAVATYKSQEETALGADFDIQPRRRIVAGVQLRSQQWKIFEALYTAYRGGTAHFCPLQGTRYPPQRTRRYRTPSAAAAVTRSKSQLRSARYDRAAPEREKAH